MEIKKKDSRIEIRLSSDMLERAKEAAEEINIPLSRILRRLLALWLEGKIKLDGD